MPRRSIIGAATVHLRHGAVKVAAVSVALLLLISALGAWHVLPHFGTEPWEVTRTQLLRQLVLNLGACVGVGILAANLGDEIARSGERLEKQRATTLDLAALKEDVIRCLSSGLLTIDRNGMVLTMNEAAADILELPAWEGLGKDVGLVVPELAPLLSELGVSELRRRAEITTRRHGSGTGATLGVSMPKVNARSMAFWTMSRLSSRSG